MSKLTVIDRNGENQEYELKTEVYREAEAAGMSVPQYLNNQIPTNPDKEGTAFEQMLAACGLFLRADNRYGIKPPTVAQILDGKTAHFEAGVLTRDPAPSSRILFPAIVIEAVENKLKADTSGYVAQFESMVSRKESIAGLKFDQLVLDYSEPESHRSRAISQGALPKTMLSITASEVSRKIPVVSLGMEITKEAQAASSLDLVTLALTRQAEIERAAIVDEAIALMLNGDTDAGVSALSTATATSYDSAVSSVAGALTHKAWIRYLRHNYRKRQIDWVICDLNAAMAIEGRTGKPVVTADDPNSPRIDALMRVANPQWQPVKVFIVEDGIVPANTIMGIDSRYAMWRVNSTIADYTALEEFVLRKTTAMRFDFGLQYYRQFDEAFDVMTLT